MKEKWGFDKAKAVSLRPGTEQLMRHIKGGISLLGQIKAQERQLREEDEVRKISRYSSILEVALLLKGVFFHTRLSLMH